MNCKKCSKAIHYCPSCDLSPFEYWYLSDLKICDTCVPKNFEELWNQMVEEQYALEDKLTATAKLLLNL